MAGKTNTRKDYEVNNPTSTERKPFVPYDHMKKYKTLEELHNAKRTRVHVITLWDVLKRAFELGEEKAAAMQPAQPSADDVECARDIGNALYRYFTPDTAEDWQQAAIADTTQNVLKREAITAVIGAFHKVAPAYLQQFADARVAELTQRNAELESKLTAVLDTVKHYENVVYKPNKDRRWAITCLRQKIDEVLATLASQGGNGGR